MKTQSLFLISSIFLFCQNIEASNHNDLIQCDSFFNLSNKCKLESKELEGRQPYHSTFVIDYDMSCDAGGGQSSGSSIKINVSTENGQNSEHVVSYTSRSRFEVDGFGPVSISDTNPNELYSKFYKNGCNLRVTVTPRKSQRTINDEQNFLAEIDNFISKSKSELQENFRLMVQYKGDYFREINDRSALACTIKRHDNVILLEDVVMDMKILFRLSFREEYSEGFCDGGNTPKNFHNDCRPDDLSRSCLFKNAYYGARGRVEKVEDAISRYLQNPDASNHHDRLRALQSELLGQKNEIE